MSATPRGAAEARYQVVEVDGKPGAEGSDTAGKSATLGLIRARAAVGEGSSFEPGGLK